MDGQMEYSGCSESIKRINIISLIIPPSPTQYGIWSGDFNDDSVVNMLVVAITNVILGKMKVCNFVSAGEGYANLWIDGKDIYLYLMDNMEVVVLQFYLIIKVDHIRFVGITGKFKFFASNIPGRKRILLVGLDLNGNTLFVGQGQVLKCSDKCKVGKIVISDIEGEKVNNYNKFKCMLPGYDKILTRRRPLKNEGMRDGLNGEDKN